MIELQQKIEHVVTVLGEVVLDYAPRAGCGLEESAFDADHGLQKFHYLPCEK